MMITMMSDHAGRALGPVPEVVPGRLQVSGLVKRFGTRMAVAGVSFALGDGITALLGPNGAGKSTLMRGIVGISSWDHGRVMVDGVDAGRDPAGARRRVGYMPERISFPAEMRVAEYLAFACAAKGVRRAGRTAAVELALTRAGLVDVRSRIVGNLSKGYRQRVGLAQALIGDPPLVVLDEPMAGLDPLNVPEIRASLSEYARDRAVLLSTHTLSDARLLSDRLLVMGSGSIVYDGPASGMAAVEGTRRFRIRVGDAGAGAVEEAVAFAGGHLVSLVPAGHSCEAVVEVSSEEILGDLARGLVGRGCSLTAMEPTVDTLEEAFRQAVLGNGAKGARS